MKENLGIVEGPRGEWAKIIVLDVGQGDAALVIAEEGEAILIDTGPPQRGEAAVLEVLADQGVDAVPYLFISHHHEDHEGSLPALLNHPLFASVQIIDPENAIVGDSIRLGSMEIQILGANGQIGQEILVSEEERADENNLSLALLVAYDDFRYFTSGDLPGGGGEPPYDTLDLETPLAPLVGDVDILLVPHHGSHTSTNENFLNQLRPEIAVISVGDQNDFFHPHPSVLQRFKDHAIKIYQTERGWVEEEEGIEIVNGPICIVTDGHVYFVKPYRIDKCAVPN